MTHRGIRELHPAILALTLLAATLPFSDDAHGEVITVGPGGMYESLLEASYRANESTELETEIRIARGVHPEQAMHHGWGELRPNRLSIETYDLRWLELLEKQIEVSGGWYQNYSQQELDPNATVLPGYRQSLSCNPTYVGLTTDITVKASNFTIQGASHIPSSSSYVSAVGECRVEVTDVNVFAMNDETWAWAYEGGTVDLRRVKIVGNDWTSSSRDLPTRVGGGLIIFAGDSLVRIEDSEISHNRVRSSWGRATGAGVFALLEGSGRLEMVRSRIEHNESFSASGADPYAHDTYWGPHTHSQFAGALYVGSIDHVQGPPDADQETSFYAHRLTVTGNRGLYDPQVRLEPSGSAVFEMTDSLIGVGDEPGLSVDAYDESEVRLVNLTVVDNKSGLHLNGHDQSSIQLVNTIAARNPGPDLVLGTLGSVTLDSNWFGPDPGFVDPAAGDYHLREDSSAIDSGNSSPTGGLGPRDLDGWARILGADVDLGAYEDHSSFLEGGLCRVRFVGGPGSVAGSPVCRCFADSVLKNTTRCSLELPGLNLAFLFPELVFGKPTPLTLEMSPKLSLEYNFESWLELNGDRLFLTEAGGFAAGGKPTEEHVLVDAFGSKDVGIFSTSFDFLEKGTKAWSTLEVEIELLGETGQGN